jgi:hypothetical protein
MCKGVAVIVGNFHVGCSQFRANQDINLGCYYTIRGYVITHGKSIRMMITSQEDCIEYFNKRTDLPKKGSTLGDLTLLNVGIAEASGTPFVVCEKGPAKALRVMSLDAWFEGKELATDEPDTPEKVADSPPAGSVWTHYKGNTYTVIGLGFSIFNRIPLVIYNDCSGKYTFYWIRTLDSWNTKIDEGTPRFVATLAV